MATLEFIVPPEWKGKKLDAFLRTVHHLSGTTIKRARMTDGGLTMDGNHIRTVDFLQAGSVVRVKTDFVSRAYQPSNEKVDIIYEDDDLLVLNKPAGMPCHPSKGHPYDTLANAFAALPNTQGLVFRSIGRLDRDTSGAVLCAKHAHAAYLLFGEKKPQKRYLALINANLPQQHGIVNEPIARESEDSQRRCVRIDGQNAATHYRVLLSDGSISLVELWLDTGRTHQIRVHMAHIGCPLSGDLLYGGNCADISRHALHCYKMELNHPLSDTFLSVKAVLPEDMKHVLLNHFTFEQLENVLKHI